MPPTPVILFRTPTLNPCATALPDPYHHVLRGKGYAPLSFPVLDEEFVGVEELVEVMKHPEGWGGVVATSRRAGEAWVNAVRLCEEAGGAPTWSHLPLFTPGPTSTTSFSASPSSPTPFPLSDSTGSAALLASFILSHLPRDSLPLLFLTGDKTLPDLPTALETAGVRYTTLEVYRTTPKPDLSARLSTLLNELLSTRPAKIWLIFFSPSSSLPILSILRSLGHLPPGTPGISGASGNTRFLVGSIGGTTSEYLRGEGVPVDAEAGKPTAGGLGEVMRGYDGRSGL